MQRETAFIESIMAYLDELGLVKETEAMEHQLYTLRHKVAYVKVQIALMNTITYSGMLHDTDKLVSYSLADSVKGASKLHRKYAKHHIENCESLSDLQDCVIDYECARFTKPDKPLNAYNTILKYKPDSMSILRPLLQKYGICSPDNIELQLPILNGTVFDKLYTINITAIKRMYECSQRGMNLDSIVRNYYSTI